MKFKTLTLVAVMTLNLVTQTVADTYSDIKGTEWYAPYINSLSSKNIINGYQDGTFRGEDTITIGEILKIIITLLDEQPLDNKTSHWASGYASKAYELSLISSENINLDEEATRTYVAKLIFSLLDIDTININSPFTDIADAEINTLYELGIVKGSVKNNEFNFYGYNSITRGEVSALVSRSIDILEKNISEKKYVHPTVTEVKTPSTDKEFEQTLLNSALKNEFETTLTYSDISFYQMRDTYQYHTAFVDSFVAVFDKYPEYFTFINHLSAPMSGTNLDCDITISLSSIYFSTSEIIYMKNEFFSEVEDIHRVLYLNGSLNSSMSQYDRAKVIFEWIVVNNEYDLTFQNASYTPYGLTQYNKGICQAYVALFNALCKMEGIDVYGVSGTANGEEHIWSMAILDGKECYIDPTFADPVPDKTDFCDFYYFDISEQNLRLTHNF